MHAAGGWERGGGVHGGVRGGADGRQLACGRMLGGMLRVAGFEDVEDLVENFAVGPWSADPATCAALRRQHWGDAAAAEHLGTVVARAEGCSLRTTPRSRDQLAAWWFLTSTRTRGFERPRLVSLPRGGELGDANPTTAELRLAFAAARRVDAQHDVEAELLWSAYCAPSPAAIAGIGWTELRAFPAARGVFRGYARMLPRWRGHSGRWGLSSIDAAILRGYSRDAWMLPMDWLKTSHGRAALDDVVLERGDVDVLSRLEQLGGGDAPLVEVKALHDASSPWTRIAVRLTRRGQAALDEGIDDLAGIPAAAIGGYVAYRAPLWAMREDAGRWEVAPC